MGILCRQVLWFWRYYSHRFHPCKYEWIVLGKLYLLHPTFSQPELSIRTALFRVLITADN